MNEATPSASQPDRLPSRSTPKPRRPAGTGSLFLRRDKSGRQTWYGQWRDGGGRLIKRRLGHKGGPGVTLPLSKRAAEAALRDAMAAVPAHSCTLSVQEVGERLLAHLETLGRKTSTLDGYRSALEVHLVPFFGPRPLDRVDRLQVERFMQVKANQGLKPKSICNYTGFLHAVFEYAARNGWISVNPVKLVDKPATDSASADIRFLSQEELEALLRVVPQDAVGRMERVLYLAAAMTGARQGELIALRWMDVDWFARKIRIRRNYVRGEFGTPKSKRSSRAVPLANRLAGELEGWYQASAYTDDESLVFPHPISGRPLDRSRLLKRFKAALMRAGVRDMRFHDLRHTFATRMASAGVPMRALQEMMGHRDFKTTLIYAWVLARLLAGPSGSAGSVICSPMVETATTIDVTEEELWEVLDQGAQERLGLSAQELLDAYDRDELDDLGEVADLLALADLLPGR